jgi:RNA polymerase sigma-70 factor (ECF subfamily)
MNPWLQHIAHFSGANADAVLAEPLAALYDAGRERWREIDLNPEDFAAHVLSRLPVTKDRAAYLRSLAGEDLYLACACVLGQPGALAAFEAHYLSRVPALVASIDRSSQFGDEVQQLVRERLLLPREGLPARLADYSGRGALMVWLRVSARRVALTVGAESTKNRQADFRLVEGLASDTSPETQLLRERHASALGNAIRRAVAALTPQQRMLLRMYFSSGMSTGQIAATLNVSRATAARQLVTARRTVYEKTRDFLKEELAIDSAEFESLARALHDELDISLHSLFRIADNLNR